QEIAVFREQSLPLVEWAASLPQDIDPRSQFVDAAAEILQGADVGFDALRAQAEFFDQRHGATSAAAKPLPRLSSDGFRLRLAERQAIVAPISFEQHLERRQVVRHPLEDL